MTDNLPTQWQEELAKHAKAVAAVERPALSRVSLKAGVMTLLDQKVPGNKLQVIVLGSIVQRVYYAGRYDPNKPEAPDCFSFSETGEGMTPHAKAFAPQNPTCAGCPQDQWGSAGEGRKGKACRENRRLLILPASVLKDGNFKGADLATIDLPVTSVKNWKNYVNLLAAGEQRPPWGVVTTISVEPDAKTQFKVNFNHDFNIGDQHLGDVFTKVEQNKELLVIPYEKTAESEQPESEQPAKKRKY